MFAFLDPAGITLFRLINQARRSIPVFRYSSRSIPTSHSVKGPSTAHMRPCLGHIRIKFESTGEVPHYWIAGGVLVVPLVPHYWIAGGVLVVPLVPHWIAADGLPISQANYKIVGHLNHSQIKPQNAAILSHQKKQM